MQLANYNQVIAPYTRVFSSQLPLTATRDLRRLRETGGASFLLPNSRRQVKEYEASQYGAKELCRNRASCKLVVNGGIVTTERRARPASFIHKAGGGRANRPVTRTYNACSITGRGRIPVRVQKPEEKTRCRLDSCTRICCVGAVSRADLTHRAHNPAQPMFKIGNPSTPLALSKTRLVGGCRPETGSKALGRRHQQGNCKGFGWQAEGQQWHK